MADIITIDDKLQLSKNKKNELERKRKIQTVQKMFQCTRCASKCEKCGTQLGMDHHCQKEYRDLRVPYRFCDACSEEYIEYIQRLQGKGNPSRYWHNDAWLEVWGKWIEYQNTIESYLKSKEFVQLLHELRPSSND